MTTIPTTPAVFWEQTEAQLAETASNVALERDAFYSQPEWDVYRMGYDSSDGHRLFAWLSVPHGAGPFPALVRMPDYASVHDIIYTSLRHRAVVMNPTYRGQRNSGGIYRASYPGLLTDGIDSPQTYVLLGAYADALRAWTLYCPNGRRQSEPSRWPGRVWGPAWRWPWRPAVPVSRRWQRTLPWRWAMRRRCSRGWATRWANWTTTGGLTRNVGNPWRQRWRWSTRWTMRQGCQAPVLMSAGRFDRSLCPLAFAEELAAALPDCDLRVYDGAAEGGGHEHGQARAGWLAERLGIAAT